MSHWLFFGMIVILQNSHKDQCEGWLVTMPTRSCLGEQAFEGFYQLKLERQHVEASSPTHCNLTAVAHKE